MTFEGVQGYASRYVPDSDCGVSGYIGNPFFSACGIESFDERNVAETKEGKEKGSYGSREKGIDEGEGMSLQQLAIRRPSGENLTAATPRRWPLSTIFNLYGM